MAAARAEICAAHGHVSGPERLTGKLCTRQLITRLVRPASAHFTLTSCLLAPNRPANAARSVQLSSRGASQPLKPVEQEVDGRTPTPAWHQDRRCGSSSARSCARKPCASLSNRRRPRRSLTWRAAGPPANWRSASRRGRIPGFVADFSEPLPGISAKKWPMFPGVNQQQPRSDLLVRRPSPRREKSAKKWPIRPGMD